MVPRTRRYLLHGAVGLVATLAGCNGVEPFSGPSRTSSPTPDGGEPARSSRSTTAPETARVRVVDSRPPVWLADDESERGSRPTPGPRERHLSSIVVDSPSRAERVELADAPDADAARRFIDGTSFDRETLYIQTHRVSACFRLELCQLSWGDGTVETDYARQLLPYDERCAVDEWAAESWLIRIPAALSERDLHSRSTSVGSGRCDRTAASGSSATMTDGPDQTDGDR